MYRLISFLLMTMVVVAPFDAFGSVEINPNTWINKVNYSYRFTVVTNNAGQPVGHLSVQYINGRMPTSGNLYVVANLSYQNLYSDRDLRNRIGVKYSYVANSYSPINLYIALSTLTNGTTLKIGHFVTSLVWYADWKLQKSDPPIIVRDYDWRSQAIGVCNSSCQQSYNVWCEDVITKDKVSDSFCINNPKAGPRPPTSVACTGGSCGYYWNRICDGCSIYCGSMTVPCTVNCLRNDGTQVNESNCIVTKPPLSDVCEHYSYAWQAGEWSACDPLTGEQTRNYACKRCDGMSAGDSQCTTPKPEEKRDCDFDDDRAFSWVKDCEDVPCDNLCGTGQKQCDVYCRNNQTRMSVSDFYCAYLGPKPNPLETCSDFSGCNDHVYSQYFEEAGEKYSVPSNLLRAVAVVESNWSQSATNGEDYGVMQLNQNNLLHLAQKLKSDYAGEYGSMTDSQLVALLIENSDRGAQANIRGAACKLRYDADNVVNLVFAGEPLEALETWWFVLTYYNGGGGDIDLLTSNYPFRVYNKFLTGVTDVYGNIMVPRIPITMPPHITFEWNGLGANSEVVEADAYLYPRTPKGFIRKTIPFDVCRDLGILHDNNGNILNLPNCQASIFSLDFPMKDYTANNAPINAFFDYSKPDYSRDNWVINYVGEAGQRQYGYSQDGYKQKSMNRFLVNGNYVAAGLGAVYGFYDGHDGYDFRTYSNMPIYATADGTVHLLGDQWNSIVIDHGNHYKTSYLHGYKASGITHGQTIKKGQLLLYTSNIGTVGPHLHLKISYRGYPVDPYGWQVDNPALYTKASRSCLWSDSVGGVLPIWRPENYMPAVMMLLFK